MKIPVFLSLFFREIGWLLTLALIRRDFEPFHMLQSHVLLLVLHIAEKIEIYSHLKNIREINFPD